MVSTKQDPANDNALRDYVVPRQPPWLFEVDGSFFASLSDAITFSNRVGKSIYCRPAPKKALP